MIKIGLILLCMAGFGLNACHSDRDKVELTGMKWVLQILDGKKVQLADEQRPVYIQFNGADKRATGMAGCNRFFGGYELDGTKLKFSQLGATRMACPDLETESAFFRMLENTEGCEIKDRQLMFLQKGKVLAVFRGESLLREDAGE